MIVRSENVLLCIFSLVCGLLFGLVFAFGF